MAKKVGKKTTKKSAVKGTKKGTKKVAKAPLKVDKEKVDKTIKKMKADFLKAKTKLIEAEKDMVSFVKKNPKKAAKIAAGIGAAIGVGIATAVMRHKKK